MNEWKFTPGPWEVGKNSSVVFAINEDEKDDEGNRVGIAQCGSEIRATAGLKFGEERDANAALVAAAPDLLAALEALMEALDSSKLEKGDFRYERAAARKAIKKAGQRRK